MNILKHMKNTYTISRTMLGISPFLIIGVFLVLVPIFIFLTVDNIRTLNNRVVEHFTGKGEALIRSLEAGTRTGVMALRWEGAKVQRLLMETALQSGIEYIFITDQDGKILAHSDSSRVNTIYDKFSDADLKNVYDTVKHRQVTLKDGTRVFEVYKRFTPARPPGPQERLRGLMERLPPHMREQFPDDWCQMHFFRGRGDKKSPEVEQFIFAGFNLERIDAAKKKHINRSILTGTILFFIGCAGMVSLFTVQAYRSARTSLVQVKAFSDEVVANMPAGLLTIGTDQTITSWNKGAADMFGIAPETARGADIAILPPFIRNIAEQVIAGEKSLSAEVQSPGGNGNTRVFDVSASPIHDEEKNTAGYLLLFKDLTDMRHLEREVERSRRLAAIGKLAAGVAHEIRNPLSSIKGFATYFKEKYKDAPDDRQTADTMIYEVERLNRAVTQLLEFARPIEITRTGVVLHDLVNHSLRLVAGDLEKKGIAAKTDIQTRKQVIQTDPDRFNQVLLNLYLNAIQAMETGGSLTVTVTDAEGGDRVTIDITDTGHGIAAIDMDKIFDPYFTTRNTGTGLGLAIVYKLVKSLGGEISVDSTPGEGTTVHMTIPAT
ncbi:MAG: ATP-binding protein [Thermodesulfobacteriota bacterium]|nr:ATP-binding protein [Thermodesulfobacteriota bacterium]